MVVYVRRCLQTYSPAEAGGFLGIRKPATDRRKSGRGDENKIPVFGVLKREGKVYKQIVKNASKQELMPIVKQILRKQLLSIPISGKCMTD